MKIKYLSVLLLLVVPGVSFAIAPPSAITEKEIIDSLPNKRLTDKELVALAPVKPLTGKEFMDSLQNKDPLPQKTNNIDTDTRKHLYSQEYLEQLERQYPGTAKWIPGYKPQSILTRTESFALLLVWTLCLWGIFRHITSDRGAERMKALGLIVNIAIGVWVIVMMAGNPPSSIGDFFVGLLVLAAISINVWNHIRLKNPEAKFFLFTYLERKSIEESIKRIEAQNKLNSLSAK